MFNSLSGQDRNPLRTNFNEKIGIDGVILSKFDSDSKGGIALSIAYQWALAAEVYRKWGESSRF